jgi:Domain of unknown function (DUF4326)
VGGIGDSAGLVVHCRRSRFDRYVGRGAGERGRFGNPFAVGRDGSRDEVIALHRLWLWDEIVAGRFTLRELAALEGKVLGCWCAPRRCHAETLVAAARWAAGVLRAGGTFDGGSLEPPF